VSAGSTILTQKSKEQNGPRRNSGCYLS